MSVIFFVSPAPVSVESDKAEVQQMKEMENKHVVTESEFTDLMPT